MGIIYKLLFFVIRVPVPNKTGTHITYDYIAFPFFFQEFFVGKPFIFQEILGKTISVFQR